MILMFFLNVIGTIIDFAWSSIFTFVPGTGDNLNIILNKFLLVVDSGAEMFYFLFGPVSSVLITYILMLEGFKHLYDILMWVIHKIPLSID